MKKTFFLIEPRNFKVGDAINPWMEGKADPEKAKLQWRNLVQLIQKAGANTETFSPPDHDLPDECFAANIGFALDGTFYVSHFRYDQRRDEEFQAMGHFSKKGRHKIFYAAQTFFEGEGDVEWAENGKIYCGHGFRTEEKALRNLENLFKKPVTGLRLVDPKYYHLDTCFRSVDPDTLLVVRDALDEKAFRLAENEFKTVFQLNKTETEGFLCNSIVTQEKTLIVPHAVKDTSVVKELETKGVTIFPWEGGEFKKSGGSARCLVLNLTAIQESFPTKESWIAV